MSNEIVLASQKTTRQIPNAVLSIIAHLVEKGYLAFLVGGAVRDHFLGLKCKDFDIVTNADLNILCGRLPGARLFKAKMLVLYLKLGGCHIEITNFSGSGTRMPSSTALLQIDARTRDFAVNAIYWNPVDNKYFDPLNAIADLKHRRLQTCYDAGNSFVDDPLRMVRAVRIGVQCRLGLDSIIADIKRNAVKISSVPQDRLAKEVHKAIHLADFESWLVLAQATHVFPHLFRIPFENDPSYKLFYSTEWHCRESAEDSVPSRLASLLLTAVRNEVGLHLCSPRHISPNDAVINVIARIEATERAIMLPYISEVVRILRVVEEEYRACLLRDKK
jgi:tRNA nucleotidyltransferase/poly(A) polymerase